MELVAPVSPYHVQNEQCGNYEEKIVAEKSQNFMRFAKALLDYDIVVDVEYQYIYESFGVGPQVDWFERGRKTPQHFG